MKISLNWINQYTSLDLSVDKLVDKIGVQLGAVEEAVDWGARYEDIVVAEIREKAEHPDADKLGIYQIDYGASKTIQVVAGDKTLEVGNKVAWLKPGAYVPATYDSEPLKLEARKLRGQMSNGMLGSAAELALGANSAGVLVLDTDEPNGTPLADAYNLNDHIIDIENKMFTHRPDCFGILGVAREIAGITGQAFRSPDWYFKNSIQSHSSNVMHGLGVTIEASDLCPRYMAVCIDNVEIKPSPIWLQSHLKRVGLKPINNVVDITNYMMHLTAQPLHAFDFDKIAKNGRADIIVRRPKRGEKMTLLDGKQIEPHKDAVLICNPDGPIALGGIMGGGNSEVDENTKRVVLECANFDMYNVRKTSMIHGIFTDAVARFNKGQSVAQLPPVLHKAVQMFHELVGANAVGDVVDGQTPAARELLQSKHVKVTADFINQRLGSNLSPKEIAKLLQNVEFGVKVRRGELKITPPFWRQDIAIPEDIVEEVGRLHGYESLPVQLPRRTIKPPVRDAMLDLETNIRDSLSSIGANEVLTYSFVHGDLLDKVGQDKKQAFELSNALSPDLQYYRLSLTPSLLAKVHPNIKSKNPSLAIFEMNKIHNRQQTKDKLPVEVETLALVTAADEKYANKYFSGAPYYQALNYLTSLLAPDHFWLSMFNILEPLAKADLYKQPWLLHASAPYDKEHSAVIKDGKGVWGIVGEYKPSVKKALKLPDFTAGFEVDLNRLALKPRSQYSALNKFPATEQDITIQVPSDTQFIKLVDVITSVTKENRAKTGVDLKVSPVDIFQKDTRHKNFTFRIWAVHPERTLTAGEVNDLLDKVAAVASKKLKAKRV